MKILQIGKYYAPVAGGIETLIQNLSEGLVSLGDQVTVLCSSSANSFSREIINGVEVIRLPRIRELFSQPLCPTLPIEYRKLVRTFDVVNVHSPNPLAESISLLFSGDRPIVASYHSDIVRQKLLLPFYAPVLRRYIARSREVIVATQSHVDHSPFLRRQRDRCHVIPYGIERPNPTPTVANQTKAQALRSRGRFALFVGRLVGYKGVDVLLDAFHELGNSTDLRLIIVGRGPLEDQLKSRAQSLGLSNQVEFAGYVSDTEIDAYYRACEFLVLPSISSNEGFGIVQVEAMARGKPTICSQLNSVIQEVGQPGVTGLLVPPANARALAKAMHELASQPERMESMGKAGLLRFESRFTREKMVRGYREVYQSVTSS